MRWAADAKSPVVESNIQSPVRNPQPTKRTIMWTRSDILQLLQLLTMIIVAAIHALWYLIAFQSKNRLPFKSAY